MMQSVKGQESSVRSYVKGRIARRTHMLRKRKIRRPRIFRPRVEPTWEDKQVSLTEGTGM